MKYDDLDLSSVNWEHGMLLTPEHFLRQERYFDSGFLWILRYATNAYGLVGGGPRLSENERGAVRHDPIVVVEQGEDGVRISVTQCRGLTPAGCIVDVDPEHPVHAQFPKATLEGVSETPVYIVCEPHEKGVTEGPTDDFNPQMKTSRRPTYRLLLQIPAERVPYSISVARIKRPPYGASYEKDSQYIPACSSLVSYSELTAAWRKIVEGVTSLAERYTELYRAIQEFIVLFRERGIETDLDVETMNFVGRMVVAVQECLYEILDPVQPPHRFFSHLRQFIYGAAVYLDLTPAARQYYEMLKETGETEFIPLLEQQKKILQTTSKWRVEEDLGVEVRSVLQSLGAQSRLERALEGKYVDFRVSAALEAMNFVFDRGGKVLYKLAAKPSRVQGYADELTMMFSQLRLEGRDKYRLILVSEPDAAFEKGSKLTAEIRLNEGSGYKRAPIILTTEARFQDQRNFEFDFDAPDVPTIMDLRVTIQAHHPIHTALLFVRHRFYASKQEEAQAQPLQRRLGPSDELPRRTGSGDVPPPPTQGVSRETESAPSRDRPDQPPADWPKPAPADAPKWPDAAPQPRAVPPRRKRLE